MKNTLLLLLSFLFILSSHQTFAQTSNTTTDTSTLINKLSNKLRESPVYINYVNQVKKIGKLTLKSAGMQSSTDESNRLYREAMDEVKNDKTLSEIERRDSMQNMLFIHYGISKIETDSLASFSRELYKTFPELTTLSQA